MHNLLTHDFLKKCYKRLEMESTEDIQIPQLVSLFCFRGREEFFIHRVTESSTEPSPMNVEWENVVPNKCNGNKLMHLGWCHILPQASAYKPVHAYYPSSSN